MITTSVIVCGVGGQGVLTASDIIAQVGLRAGLDVKKSEVHGMAQRGGSVVSAVRFGEKVYSPLVSRGMGDYILAFEKLEALRQLFQLKKSGHMIVNDYEIKPMPVLIGRTEYPDRIIERIKECIKNVNVLNATNLALQAGNIKATNTVLLGALARILEFDKSLWFDAIKKRFPKKTFDMNKKAFSLGFDYICK